jgi:CheY-like chemotaxis protein/nitrogen-specific signal transduction histidine kinase
LSNQFRVPHRPADDQFKRIDLLAWSAAQAIERHQTDAALRCSDQRKDEFMATLAHELRNPLAPLRDSLNILQRGPHDDDDRLLSIMARQLKHMERLVDDLLDISRIAHGHIELKREPLDLNDAVCDAVETTRPLVASKRHHLYVALADAALPVHGDPTRLGQIFTNLINNSVHYMAAGGNIWVSSARRDGQAQVSVRDTGQGLTQEQLPAMFELFTQGEHSHLEEASSGRGLGIGLALVQKLTMLHGGEVIADSAGADQGSTFTVTLPLAAGGIQPAATPPATPARPLPEDLSVLVVDDYKDGADGLAMLLELEDIQVHTVYSAAAALQALQENQFTVALIDIGMPEMNGLELAEHIRAQSEFDALQLIALTGWGQEADIERSRQAVFDHHIIKPPDLETLLPLLSGRAD